MRLSGLRNRTNAGACGDAIWKLVNVDRRITVVAVTAGNQRGARKQSVRISASRSIPTSATPDTGKTDMLSRGPIICGPGSQIYLHKHPKSTQHKGCLGSGLMTASGHKQTSRDVRVASALPPIADIRRMSWHVRFVPLADMERIRRTANSASARPGA